MRNRYVRMYLIAGIIVLIFIFVAPLFFYSGPEEDRTESYYRTVTFLIPIAIAVFILPTATYKLKEWDIHLNFITDKDASGFQITVSNFGETTFSFNRIAFVSYKRFFSLGNGYLGHTEASLTMKLSSMEQKPLARYYMNILDIQSDWVCQLLYRFAPRNCLSI